MTVNHGSVTVAAENNVASRRCSDLQVVISSVVSRQLTMLTAENETVFHRCGGLVVMRSSMPGKGKCISFTEEEAASY